MMRNIIPILSIVFIILCIVMGAYGLYRNSSNVMAYAMLGLGLGGLIVVVGLLFNRTNK